MALIRHLIPIGIYIGSLQSPSIGCGRWPHYFISQPHILCRIFIDFQEKKLRSKFLMTDMPLNNVDDVAIYISYCIKGRKNNRVLLICF